MHLFSSHLPYSTTKIPAIFHGWYNKPTKCPTKRSSSSSLLSRQYAMHHPAQPEENMQRISELLCPSLKNQVYKNLTKISSSFRKCFLQVGHFRICLQPVQHQDIVGSCFLSSSVDWNPLHFLPINISFSENNFPSLPLSFFAKIWLN